MVLKEIKCRNKSDSYLAYAFNQIFGHSSKYLQSKFWCLPAKPWPQMPVFCLAFKTRKRIKTSHQMNSVSYHSSFMPFLGEYNANSTSIKRLWNKPENQIEKHSRHALDFTMHWSVYTRIKTIWNSLPEYHIMHRINVPPLMFKLNAPWRGFLFET